MRKWVRIERAETGEGFYLITGYEDKANTTLFFKDLSSVERAVRGFFGEGPPIEIDVKETITIQERNR